jgi:hypothetical protein
VLVHRLLVIVLALSGGTAFGGAAAAASLQIDPTTVVQGGTVEVSGSCEPNSSGYVMSEAFLHDAAHDFAGVGAVPFTTGATGDFTGSTVVPATVAPGAYQVSVRCGGGNVGIGATLTVVAASDAASPSTSPPSTSPATPPPSTPVPSMQPSSAQPSPAAEPAQSTAGRWLFLLGGALAVVLLVSALLWWRRP